MPSSNSTSRELYQIWMRIVNKLNELESLPRNFGIDIPLHPSEIHTIQAIGDYPESNVRKVAEILGITPGAASQVISKLAKRNLVEKVRGRKNEKEVHLTLSAHGAIAYQVHEASHESIYLRVIERIGPLTEEERSLLFRILHSVESVYDERLAELTNGSRVMSGSIRADTGGERNP